MEEEIKLNLTLAKQVKSTILVCAGRYNRLPYTRRLINNGNLLLIVLEVGSPRSRHWDIDMNPFLSTLMSHAFSHGKSGEGALLGLFYRDTNTIHDSSMT